MLSESQQKSIARALETAQARYVAQNPRSREQHMKAAKVLPGGNTRSVLFSTPFPITLTSSRGCTVTSLDGREYIDFLGEYTAGLYGHSDPTLAAAVKAALEHGWVMGGHIQAEEELAQQICKRFPSIQLIRFTNSGTEANLYAISAAKAISGKPKVLVFEGAYHGGVFVFGTKPSPLTAPFEFVRAPYNDIAGTQAVLDANRDAVGTIVVEPMQGSGGCIPADPAFLRMLREWTDRNAAILVFDEVMTSRLAPGGLQGVHGIRPDLTTLGKYIGGGFSFGAFGGREDLMVRFDPARPDALGHAGTFNNNVFTMTAGAAGLRDVYTPQVNGALNARGDELRRQLNVESMRALFPLQFTGRGSMMNMHPCRGEVRSILDLVQCHAGLRDLFYFEMLARGIWLARRGMVNLSLPMEDRHCAALANAVREFVDTCNSLLGDGPRQ